MKITNEEIVERIMRMGMEYRSGIPREKLWDLATEQLKKARQEDRIVPIISFNDWKNDTSPYAFIFQNGKLQLECLIDKQNVKLISWRTPRIPEVEICRSQN